MFTEIEIKSPTGRAYLEYYFDGARQREYNGNRLGLDIYPNKAKKQSDKNRLLQKLKFEFEKALEKGWNPQDVIVSAVVNSPVQSSSNLDEVIQARLQAKLNENYSKSYKRDLKSVTSKFLNFLSTKERRGSEDSLSEKRIEEFLNTFNTSNRNYMNKRQTLNVILKGVIQKTPRKKSPEKLHDIYQKKEMKQILNFLKSKYPKLHLVALLAYGCLLRPHEESRLLQKRNIRDHKIYLSGEENKGKKVRVVNIPEYVYKELELFIQACSSPVDNIFTGSETPFNDDYFKTQWSRAKQKLKDKHLIQDNQTLYSFRHTAVVEVYKKTKDVYLIQRLLGHSTITVTLKYLRGLGEIGSEDLKNAMPEL